MNAAADDPPAPMRITLIGPTYPFRGGIAHHTTHLARALRAAGHDLQWLTITRQYPKRLYPGKDDREPGPPPPDLPSHTPTLDSLNPLTWLRVVRLARRHRSQVVLLPWWVAWWLPSFGLIARLLRLRRTPVWFICHNVIEHEGSPLKRRMTRWALGSATGCLVQSKEDLDRLRELLPTKPAVWLPHPIYDAVAPEASAPTQPPAPGEDWRLLCFGFVRPYKGIDVLLQAMARLHNLPLHLHIVGEAWQGGDELRAKIRDLHLGDRVTFEDRYVANDEIPALFAAAHYAVLPYRSATGSGALQLAFGLQTPVIATRVGGLAEAVEDGVNGLLCEPENADDLAAAIRRACNAELCARLTSGTTNARKRYSWEGYVDRLLQFIAA